MKTSLFSPILILLILTLFAKASVLFGRIQEQTTYNADTTTSSMIVDTAYANTSPAPGEATTADSAHGVKPQESVKPEEGKADVKSTDVKPVDGAGANVQKAPVTTAANKTPVNNLTKSEIELLKELSKRREKLEGDKKDIDIREQVLKATENKIDQKVVELKRLQAQLEELLKQHDQKENAKLLSLVKIYETMKPKDAAKIFNELEMPILVRVVSSMKEVKVAPIIASMDSVKARDLSVELANQKPLN